MYNINMCNREKCFTTIYFKNKEQRRNFKRLINKIKNYFYDQCDKELTTYEVIEYVLTYFIENELID